MELLKRARRGDLEEVKKLIHQQRVDVNTKDHSNQTALYCACEKGRTEVARYLLDNGAKVNLGAKSLIAAVRHNHYDCVKLLLERDADANCTNAKLESPMSVALQKQRCSIILLLLQYGAMPSTSFNDTVTIQLLKLAKMEDAKAIQKLIDDSFINVTSESTFLAGFSFAYKYGPEKLVEKLLSDDSCSQIEQLFPDVAYYSAKNNWPAILSKMIGKEVDVNVLTEGQTPLYVACKEGHESVVDLLLSNRADPNVPSKLGTSKDFSLPLQAAVWRGNAVIVDKLLQTGAELDLRGEPLLYIACSGAAELKAVGETGETRSVGNMLPLIRLLVSKGVNVNAVSDDGDTALYRACRNQQLQIVQILLEAGADVNPKSSHGHHPLIAACDSGNAELINLLINAGADVKCLKSNNETCLHAAVNAYLSSASSQTPTESVSAKSGIVSTIKSLLEAGIDVNACCSEGETVLYRASKAGHEVIVRLLLEAGADTSGSTSCRPLYAACEHGYTQIVDLLLQHGADPNASSTFTSSHGLGLSLYLSLRSGIAPPVTSTSSLPICCALTKDYTDVVNLLLQYGADVNKQDQLGKSALIYFVELLSSQRCKTAEVLSPPEEGNLSVLTSMLLVGGDPNQGSRRDGHNPLHIASSFGMCDVMTELIQHGADCNHLTSSGKSALDLAVEKGHDAAAELLLKNGADPGRETPATAYGGVHFSYDSYQTAMPVLCVAAKNGRETMVEMLLKHLADVNASDQNGNTALHLATSNAIIERLLNAGAHVNAMNDEGRTVLSIVCEKRQADSNIVETLLKFGANPNTHFPLHAACICNNLDTVRLLLTHGADANRIKESQRLHTGGGLWLLIRHPPVTRTYIEPSPLCFACTNGNVAMVDCLLQNGADATFADNNGKSVLHFALQRLGQQENSEEYDPIVTLLLQHNAEVNVVSSSGETPLYVSCMKGLTSVVKQLLDCRADVGLTTSNSHKYPLMIACERKFTYIAIMLLDRGADASVRKEDQTPLKIAAANGDVVLVKKLLTCGADVNQMQNSSNTALHAAMVRYKSLKNETVVKIVQMLLKSGAKTNALNRRGKTPLYLACKLAGDPVNTHAVQTLLENGADPNICPSCVDQTCRSTMVTGHQSPWWNDMYGNVLPPLSAAASRGNSELAMLLIKFGARLDDGDKFGRTALHFAIGGPMYDTSAHLKSTMNDTSTVKILLAAGANVNATDRTGASPLFLACEGGNSEVVNLLLSHGANPDTEDKFPIHAACRGLHYGSAKLLLEYNADVTVRDTNGKTALHHALEAIGLSCVRSMSCVRSQCDTSVVQLLLDNGADIDATSHDGETPLYVACSNGLTSVVATMLESGAKVQGDSGKKLPLIVACRNEHLSVAQLLLTNGADPNALEEGNRHHRSLPLHIAAADGNSELVELLLKHGANIDVADPEGNTALHHAIGDYYQSSRYSHKVMANSGGGVKSVIDILLENKADVNLVNSSGETPLCRAASNEMLGSVSKMLQVYGGNPNKGSPLTAACRKQNVELVDVLLKHGADPNLASTSCYRGSRHELPLFIAADAGNSDIITSLINAGASVNAVNQEGRSVVCFAAEELTSTGYYQPTETRKKLSTIRLLLQHGAHFNALMPDGRSPLCFVVDAIEEAQRCGGQFTSVVELLQLMVKHGAMLLDPSPQRANSVNYGTLRALATFDGKHDFVVDLLRAGAGFQLIASCCNAVATNIRKAKSIRLCQAAVLAGYTPSDEELHNLQLAAARDGVLDQLVNWLNEDRQRVPSLLRQCRVAIRRQLSAVVHYQTILPAVDKLPLPNDLKLYLQFDGKASEVDLTADEERTCETNGDGAEDSNSEGSVDDRSEYFDYMYYLRDLAYASIACDPYYRYWYFRDSDNDSDDNGWW